MGVSHLGAGGALPTVSTRQSPPKPAAVLDPAALAAKLEARQDLPEQAKGAAKGHSLEAKIAKWIGEDGALDRGPRFSQGLMGALIELQMQGAADAEGTTETIAEPSNATTPPADTTGGEVTPDPSTVAETVPTEAAATETPPAGATSAEIAADLLADITPPAVDETILDPRLLAEGSAA
jgi:hypothetical protein